MATEKVDKKENPEKIPWFSKFKQKFKTLILTLYIY